MNKKKFWNVFRYACTSGLMDCKDCPLAKASYQKCKRIRVDYKFFKKWLKKEIKR